MAEDTKDKLWELAFETYYDSYYEEIVADKLVYRWQLFDQISKVLIALTASGSAVSGWALWNQPGFRNIWVVLAGLGAVLSVIHAALSVSSRLKEWRDVKTSFVVLRIDLETFRNRMALQPDFPLDKFIEEYEQYRKRYSEAMSRIENDLLLTPRLKNRSQDALDIVINDKIVHD